MDDLSTLCLVGLCLVGLVVFFAMSFISRFLRGVSGGFPSMGGGTGSSSQGGSPLHPTYDDPDIESHGSFGRPQQSNPLPGRRFKLPDRLRRTGRVDSKNIKSRGGFGRSKD